MAPKPSSPAAKKAARIREKYHRGFRRSPTKAARTRRCLQMIVDSKVSIRQAAKTCGLDYMYVFRRQKDTVGIDRRSGPVPVFSRAEEEKMATWLAEMARRGMGLQPHEFMDMIGRIVTEEKRVTPFKDGRPGYSWYYAFMARNDHIVGRRKEVPLEYSRSRLTKEQMDRWYHDYREFLVTKQLLDKPASIWNADECGFTMGSKAGTVIGPVRTQKSFQVPHVTGSSSKERLTTMFCCSAAGVIMPPFLVYPRPKPAGCNPLNGALPGTVIEYTKKGWMDALTFVRFIDHFDQHAGTERPVLLILDSVSSHVDMAAFSRAAEKGIELYRLVPNATHLMQPLDKGVFGALKTKWHQVTRRHTRDFPGSKISKPNFAEKLAEAFNAFYRPLTVINSFKATGLYPVDRSQITVEMLAPGLTYEDQDPTESADSGSQASTAQASMAQASTAQAALDVYDSVLSTPVRERYKTRVAAGCAATGLSPAYVAYRKLHEKASGKLPAPATARADLGTASTNLDILAEVALRQVNIEHDDRHETPDISPVVAAALVLPSAPPRRPPPKRLVYILPDNLTSATSLRTMATSRLDDDNAVFVCPECM